MRSCYFLVILLQTPPKNQSATLHSQTKQTHTALPLEKVLKLSLVVSTSRQIEIEIENVLSVETNF
jgi:hypothetical protein